jgi:transcriptional regulator with XRE-family HTH domain
MTLAVLPQARISQACSRDTACCILSGMPRSAKPEELTSGFARRLRHVRAAYGASIGQPELSQADFVRALNLDVQAGAYRRYDNGKIEPPMAVLAAIRRLTGISLDYLVCGMGNGMDDLAKPSHQAVTTGTRLRWAREQLEPSVAAIANVFAVSPGQWVRYEDGTDALPLTVAVEVAQRFGVTLDYLYRGILTDGMEPRLLEALILAHPELAPGESHHPRRAGPDADEADRGPSADDASNRRDQCDGTMCP